MINRVASKYIRKYKLPRRYWNAKYRYWNAKYKKNKFFKKKKQGIKRGIRALRAFKYTIQVYKRHAKLFMKFGLSHVSQLLKLIAFVNLMIKRREEAQEYITAFGRNEEFTKSVGIFGGQSESKNRIIQLMLLKMERRYREKISVSYCVLFPDIENLSYMSSQINEVKILITENELKKAKKFHKYVLFFSSSLNIWIERRKR